MTRATSSRLTFTLSVAVLRSITVAVTVQERFEGLSGMRAARARDFFGRSGDEETPTTFAAFRTQVNYPIG